MAEKEHPGATREREVERSSEDIRQDIAKEKENISQTVEQIGERIKEDLDWREYVKDSPYLAMGIAAGLGYVASGMFRTRDTPMERVIRSIAEEVHDSLGSGHGGAVGTVGLIKMALLGIVSQTAAGWIKNATSTTSACDGAGTRSRTAGDSTKNTNVDASKETN